MGVEWDGEKAALESVAADSTTVHFIIIVVRKSHVFELSISLDHVC